MDLLADDGGDRCAAAQPAALAEAGRVGVIMSSTPAGEDAYRSGPDRGRATASPWVPPLAVTVYGESAIE